MIKVDVKDSASLDKALKKFKKKVERAKVIHEVRDRQYFVKPSVVRRGEILKAKYKQKLRESEW